MKEMLSFLVFFILLNLAYAEEPTVYTLDECVQVALTNNPGYGAAKMTEDAAKEDIATAKGKYYPEVGFQTGYRRFETHAFLPAGIGGPDFPSFVGPINDYKLNVQTNYMLFDSGLRSADLATARAQLSAAQQDSGRTRVDIVYHVQTAFYQVLQAEDGVELAMDRLARSKDHLKIAEQRKSAGAVPKADVTRSRTEVASAELDVVAADSALRIANGQLNEAMGRSAAEPLKIAKAELIPPDPAQTNIQDALQKAIQSRPEILAAQKRAEAKSSQIKAVRSDILPKVRAEAGYGWRDDNFDPYDQDWWVGVTLNVPVFDGGVRKHRIAKSKIEANRELQQVEQVKLGVQQEVWTAYSQWMESFQALQSSNAMKAEAAESVDLIRARYQEGAGTINDLLDAELALNDSETQLNNARYRVQIAYAAFLRASGQL